MEENNGNQGWQNNQNGQQPKQGLSWSQPTRTTVQSGGTAGGSGNPVPTPGGSAPQGNKPPMQSTQPQPKRWGKTITVVVVVVALVALAMWTFGATNKTSPSDESIATSTSNTAVGQKNTAAPAAPVVTTTTNALIIASPQDAGMEVAVSHITVPVPTWVVIYENHNGQPGNALGASLFSSDKTSGVVDLLRGTLPGQTYIVGEARDDGDHVFSLQKDQAVLNAQGSPVWVSFKTN